MPIREVGRGEGPYNAVPSEPVQNVGTVYYINLIVVIHQTEPPHIGIYGQNSRSYNQTDLKVKSQR